MKKKIFVLLSLLVANQAISQQMIIIYGKVIDSQSKSPLAQVIVEVLNSNTITFTDTKGYFSLHVNYTEKLMLQCRSKGYKTQLLPLEPAGVLQLDLGLIVLEEDFIAEQQHSTIGLMESDFEGEQSTSESTPALLGASKDAFTQVSFFTTGQARFKIRGLDSEYGTVVLNGIAMNSLNDRRPQWAPLSGLNDVTREQEYSTGSSPTSYTFGGIQGSQFISTRASAYRPGTKISFTASTSRYNWRTAATHSYAPDKRGWSFTVSATRQWASSGYFDGTSNRDNAFFSSIEKKINARHSLNLTMAYTQLYREKNSTNTEEVTALAGTRYNSYWGYQNGSKRNSRYRNNRSLLLIGNHYWKINNHNQLNSGFAYHYTTTGNSRLNSGIAKSPDPVHYRKLPSYYSTLHNNSGDYVGNTTENQILAESNRLQFLENKQLDWDQLIYGNTLPQTDSDGKEYGRIPGESIVVLYEDRTHNRQLSANTQLTSRLSETIFFNAAAALQLLSSENYQKLVDLLGGHSYTDKSPFLTGDQQQPNLDNPNRTVGVGDKFGYHYTTNSEVLTLFSQFQFNYPNIDFYIGQQFLRSSYQREGHYRNGNYPFTSKGKSPKIIFDTFGFKGGITYKYSGKQFLQFHGAYYSKAPTLAAVFPAIRHSTTVTENLQNETVATVDAGYQIQARQWKLRLNGYFSRISNITALAFYFTEGIALLDNTKTTDAFVTELVTGLAKKNLGVELGVEYTLTQTLKLTATAAYGEYTYDSNPNVKISTETQPSFVDFGAATLQKYKQPGMPQQAYSLGLEYRDPKFWWIGINTYYVSHHYIALTPLSRSAHFTSEITNALDFDWPYARRILQQQRLDPVTLFNLIGGKSWKISALTIGCFAMVNNVLNTSYKNGGFEQPRNATYSQLTQDLTGPNRAFGPKYSYNNGRTFFLNLYINF